MNKPTRYYSTKQEKRVAKLLEGKRTSNSGATLFDKGDIKLDNWLIECKTVTKEQKTFTIKREWLEKNREEAVSMRKLYNALIFDFGDDTEYAVIDINTFKKLIIDNC